MGNAHSLTELRKAVVNDPRNAQLRHMLGAEMAQQKDYEGAVMEMSAALAFNPLMHVARFQLGLLHLTMARPDHAISVLAPLENLNDAAALKHFKRGLDALIADDLQRCVNSLQTGITLSNENEPLKRDMQMLLDRVRERAVQQTAAQPDDFTKSSTLRKIEPCEPKGPVRTDFSLYNGP
ncbi:MAG TPA: hypothetical protein VET48_08720 [Steroidobacteraceae bacterium]|nr:hypothetical protein [Steroidobacteraceae bacterium]